MIYTTIIVDTWETARKIQLGMSKGSTWVYRGQSDANWSLQTKFERLVKIYSSDYTKKFYLQDREQYILNEFIRRAHHYNISLPAPTEIIEWLALIQHFGGPTRLLDFTYSFYVAAFFAMEESTNDASIWAVDTCVLDEALTTIIKDKTFYDDKEYLNHVSVVNYYLSQNKQDKIVIDVQPNLLHERLSIQQGLFLFPCDISSPFEENLNSTIKHVRSKNKKETYIQELDKKINYKIFTEYPIIKIIIPRGSHKAALYDLKDMNITSASLFPGLDGFARSFLLNFRAGDVDEDFYKTP